MVRVFNVRKRFSSLTEHAKRERERERERDVPFVVNLKRDLLLLNHACEPSTTPLNAKFVSCTNGAENE